MYSTKFVVHPHSFVSDAIEFCIGEMLSGRGATND